jgi:hypothetical protein
MSTTSSCLQIRTPRKLGSKEMILRAWHSSMRSWSDTPAATAALRSLGNNLPALESSFPR